MIRRFKAFLETVRVGNVSIAAENLYTSQSTISTQLKSLENQLGVKLFDRTKKSLSLNEQGKIFLGYVETICQLYDEAVSIINNMENLELGTLSVSAHLYFGSYILPRILKVLKNKYPNIMLNIGISSSRQVITEVLSNKHELGIIGEMDSVKTPQLISEHLFVDKLIPIFSPESKWCDFNIINPNLLKDEIFILFNEYSSTKPIIEKSFRKKGINIKNYIILNNPEAIKRAVIDNLGISIIPNGIAELEIKLGLLRTIPIQDIEFKRDILYIYRDDKTLSRVSQEFLKICKLFFQSTPV